MRSSLNNATARNPTRFSGGSFTKIFVASVLCILLTTSVGASGIIGTIAGFNSPFGITAATGTLAVNAISPITSNAEGVGISIATPAMFIPVIAPSAEWTQNNGNFISNTIMAGLGNVLQQGTGNAVRYTPISTGNVLITIDGTYQASAGTAINVYYGTGVGPAFNSLLSGSYTELGAAWVSAQCSSGCPFSRTVLLKGAAGTTYWFDLAMSEPALHSPVATLSASTVTATIVELP